MTIQANFPNVQPSLLLDFANAKQLPPSVNFTRATTATYYDGNTTAKAEQNFVADSQSFASSNWSVNGATKTSTSVTDPAGGSTALTLTKVSDNGYSLRYFTLAPCANRTFTLSFYLKGSGTVQIYMDNVVDQSINTIVTLSASWTRYSVTGTWNSTVSNASCGVAFTGGATATSVDVAFCQMEERSTATAYTATSGQPITNYIPVLLTAGGGQPRFDHNPTTSESLGLLVEEQRTNIINRSQPIGSGWITQGSSISATAIAPDGTLSGVVIQEDTTGGIRHGVYTNSMGAYSTSPTTFSVYAKAGVRNKLVFVGYNSSWSASSPVLNISSGTPVGNGWFRVSWTVTPTSSSGTAFVEIWPADASDNIYYTGSGWNAMSVWGVQVEAGSFPSSFIQTTGAAATRAADIASMTGANFTSWFNNGEGTFYSEVSFPAPAYNSSNTYHFEVSDGTASNRLIGYTGGSQAQMFVSVGGTTQAAIVSTSPPAINTSYRCAFLYEVNNFALSVNAQTPVTDTSGTVPSANKLNIAANYAASEPLNGWMKKLAYYPQAVTSAQLQALTS